MLEKPTVQLASLPDRQKLVAEIFLGNDQIVEISQEGQIRSSRSIPIPWVGHGLFR